MDGESNDKDEEAQFTVKSCDVMYFLLLATYIGLCITSLYVNTLAIDVVIWVLALLLVCGYNYSCCFTFFIAISLLFFTVINNITFIKSQVDKLIKGD